MSGWIKIFIIFTVVILLVLIAMIGLTWKVL